MKVSKTAAHNAIMKCQSEGILRHKMVGRPTVSSSKEES